MAITVILCAWFISISSGLLGSFLMLRKQAMMADAISHAVLPGLVIAYFLSGSRDPLPMLIGASVIGLLAAYLIEAFASRFRIQEDAAIGVTYTWLFALGVVLISAFAGDLDIDQECVLFGEIAFVPFDIWFIGDVNMGPRALYITSLLVIVVSLFIVISYKGLLITSFAPDYADARGISSRKWHFLLMGLVALNTVLSFEMVGAILVVGLTILPPASAYLLVNRLQSLIWLSIVFGLIASVVGYFISVGLDVSISATIVSVAGIQFLIVVGLTQSMKKRKLQEIL